MIKRLIIYISTTFFIIFSSCTSYADQEILSLFPIENYGQSVSTWLNSADSNYEKSLLATDIQNNHMKIFFNHYFGDTSPWNANYVNAVLHQTAPNDLISLEQEQIKSFTNDGKNPEQIGYGENYRPYSQNWIDDTTANIHLSGWNNLVYQANNRAIAIDNLHARILPTEDVYLNSFKYAGSGYPFDLLQISAVWVGTPVYVIVESRDHAWSLVLTPDFIGWVKTNGLAHVSKAFVDTWSTVAKNHLAATIHTQTNLFDNTNHRFLMTTYIGTVFPSLKQKNDSLTLMVPVSDDDGNAVIKYADASSNQAAVMPITATPHHFADLMTSLVGRPYGWGGMYFYNDCSAELKSLYTPFGIYLMRHSSDQINSGRVVDKTADTQENRLSYLMQNGHKLMTIIYIYNHIVLYVGNYNNDNGNPIVMTYQNLWGFSPNPANRRVVIGEAAFLPMLLQFPEDPSLNSQANKKLFQVSFLDQTPTLLTKNMPINMRALMNVEEKK